MTKPAVQLFSVKLRHLSADGRNCAADLPSVQLHYLNVNQVRSILASLEGIAAMVKPPAEPEVRISNPRGEFVVHVRNGGLHLVSWSSTHKGGAVTPAQVIEVLTQDDPKPQARAAVATRGTSSPLREKLTLFALGAAIVAVNCFTVWILTRPPRSLLGEYRLLPQESAERLLSEVAGAYETGTAPGDRRMEIKPDASVRRVKFGPGGSIKDEQTFTVQPAESKGMKALLTSRKSLITVKDSLSVVLYGDTYKRVLTQAGDRGKSSNSGQ